MNVAKLKESINALRENLGEGLVSTDIYSSQDGQSVAGWNSNPKACALFNNTTNNLNKSLAGSGFPTLGRYYLLNLIENKTVVVIPLGQYQWGMLIDNSKTQMGLLINVALPQAIDLFEEAISE